MHARLDEERQPAAALYATHSSSVKCKARPRPLFGSTSRIPGLMGESTPHVIAYLACHFAVIKMT